jgi:hypothetical protein
MKKAVLTILRAVLIDAAIERMHDMDAEAKHIEAEAALEAVEKLIDAAKATRLSLQHMRGPELVIYARSTEHDNALRVIDGGAA